MFSKKSMVAAGAVILIVLNGVVFSFNYIRQTSFTSAAAETALFFVSPVQAAVTGSINFGRDLWGHYFYLVDAAKENRELRRKLAEARLQIHECSEIRQANDRLKDLVDFKKDSDLSMQAARVVARDPSPWYRSVIIDKGKADGVERGSPVVVPDGVVGQVTERSSGYAKVLLIIDRNSAVDAMVQRTRTRGVVSGLSSENESRFDFALRKQNVRAGDTIITSGLDGVYPKGLRIGRVSEVIRRNSGIFQEVEVMPYADFHKLEEVLVVLNSPDIDEVLN
ncbi:MAG: rod shape-determining protein MreC [Desulfobacterales bacterium]